MADRLDEGLVSRFGKKPRPGLGQWAGPPGGIRSRTSEGTDPRQMLRVAEVRVLLDHPVNLWLHQGAGSRDRRVKVLVLQLRLG